MNMSALHLMLACFVNVSPPCLMSSALLYVYAGTVKVYMTSQYLYPYIFPIGLCAKMIMKEVTQC